MCKNLRRTPLQSIVHVLLNMPSIFSFSFDLYLTMLLSFFLLGFLLLSSSISCSPVEASASRWGYGGSTGIIAGGVFPLPCDCLSKCVSICLMSRMSFCHLQSFVSTGAQDSQAPSLSLCWVSLKFLIVISPVFSCEKSSSRLHNLWYVCMYVLSSDLSIYLSKVNFYYFFIFSVYTCTKTGSINTCTVNWFCVYLYSNLVRSHLAVSVPVHSAYMYVMSLPCTFLTLDMPVPCTFFLIAMSVLCTFPIIEPA